MELFGLPPAMAAAFGVTVFAGSIGFVHYCIVHGLGVNPFAQGRVNRPQSDDRVE